MPALVNNRMINIAQALYDQLCPRFRRGRSVFLVGKDLKDKNSLRNRLYDELKKSRVVRVYYPEYMFNDVMKEMRANLLVLENALARSVDAVVICPESPGSIAELGAFSNHPELKQKLIVIGDEQYKDSKGFIRVGILKYIETQNTSKVLWYNYQQGDIAKLNKKVVEAVRKINDSNSSTSYLYNSILLPKIILALFHVFGSLPSDIAISILTMLDPGEDFELFIHAHLTILRRRGHLCQSGQEYDITNQGTQYLLKELTSKADINMLDWLRIEALTYGLRRKMTFEKQARIS